MSLQCILLSERSRSEKVTYCTIPFILHSGTGGTMEMVNRTMVARHLGLGRGQNR